MSKTKAPIAPPDDATAVDLRLFSAVSMLRASDDIRWYLCGVHVMPNPAGPGVLIVATNGHQMAIAHDPDGRVPGPQTLACKEALAKAVRSYRGELKAYVVIRGTHVVAVDGEGQEFHAQPGPALLEGKFPAALGVLKPILDDTLQAGMHGHFDPTYIKALGRVANRLRARSPMAHWTHPNGTLYTRFSGEPSLVVVTMNLRDANVPPHAVPDPIKSAIEHHAAALLAAEAETKARAEAARTVVNADATPEPAQAGA